MWFYFRQTRTGELTKADLFQFCHDTVPLKGSLENILSAVTENDIREAVHMGACNIYHGACHNIVHERQKEITQSLYKSAVLYYRQNIFWKVRCISVKERNYL